jgi:hypothetical protein
MNRLHATLVAGFLALAAVLGTLAATHTVSLGSAQQSSASTTSVVARTKQLDRFAASLRHALAKKPPALPTVPAVPKTSPAPASAAAPQRVIYRRPPPIVVVKHTHHGDDGGGYESEGGGGDD